jgi:hypothetical protein
VRQSRGGRVSGAGGGPAICSGIVSTPGTDSWRCGWCRSRGPPWSELCEGSPVGVQIAGAITTSTPDNHFAAGPDGGVT